MSNLPTKEAEIATTTDAVATVKAAKRPEDVFGVLDGDKALQLAEVRRVYRRLARAVHPDAGGDNDAAANLNRLFEAATDSIERGTYGTSWAAPVDPILLRTRRHAYKVTELVAQGDSCNVYAATHDPGEFSSRAVAPVLIKVARRPNDNDLLVNEAKMLKRLLSNRDTYNDLSMYLPEFIETFGYRPKDEKKPRQASAFAASYKLFNLEQVRERYPNGVHPKDMAWMLRRLLFSLARVHENAVVHGAVLPPHVLLYVGTIEEPDHGLVLCDWKYAVEEGKRVRAISKRWREAYPEEIFDKRGALPGTDIFMAIRCMVYVLGGDPLTGELPESVPAQIRRFFRGCSMRHVKRRPQDAAGLLGEFDELIERMWGPKRFRPFVME